MRRLSIYQIGIDRVEYVLICGWIARRQVRPAVASEEDRGLTSVA
jgi:hypothetical protein